MKIAIEKLVNGGFVLALVLMLSIGIVSSRSTRQLAAHAESVKHTQEILTRLKSLLSHMTDSEAGQRGCTLAHSLS